MQNPLSFELIASCSKTKAKASTVSLPHSIVKTPVFMPVATQAIMKSIFPSLLEDCDIILNNTYHLAFKPSSEKLLSYGGSHEWMKWNKSILTDSGGYQMVSLAKLMSINEDCVEFTSHFDKNTRISLTPEMSIHIQNSIGSDIMMQLDDVVSSLTTGPRVEEAMWRSIRWLDRCIAANKNKHSQNLFPIIQGGLDLSLRRICITEMVKRDMPGYAIGGLSGGESKDEFWRVVSLCTDLLPRNKPIYCMGVGYAEDLVVCVALGVDMFDCVFPTRTARFGNALTRRGALKLQKPLFRFAFDPIEKDCPCTTCKTYSRSYIHTLLLSNIPAAVHLISIHNIAFQLNLMKDMRNAIFEDRFVEWVQNFMWSFYKDRISKEEGGDRFGGSYGTEDCEESKKVKLDPGKEFKDGYPVWITNALRSVNITLLQ